MAAAPGPPDPELIGPRPKADRSLVELLSDLAAETTRLIREEFALFKAELLQRLSRLGVGAAAIVAGGVVAFSGWLVLLVAAVLGLAHLVPPWLAALIVALVVLAIGVGLVFYGKSRFNRDALALPRTARSLREDRAWIREQLR
ncbi:MAG: phage holin family protein [Alphaproteobacteria bacterium]|nr:phage holin family protein [Alphaproteobacteria bacterium]MBV9861065.1 phage holin family protein [Alphaproteobacteria bacterium]